MRRQQTRSAVYSLRLLLFVTVTIAVALPTILKAAPPSWWTTRGVLDATKQANDYAAVNQGQVKQIATQAMLEMDAAFTVANLAVDLTDALHTQVNGWHQPNASRSDYESVNLGQLKNIALPFYARFKNANYTDRYPWTGSATPANDYAPANIGQVKNLFSFDFSLPGAGLDLDHDSLGDYWELKYFGHTGVDPNAPLAWNPALTNLQAYQQGLNPYNPFDGQPPVLSIIGGDQQTASAGGFVSQALAVQVSAGGNAVCNTLTTFAVTQNGGQVQATISSVQALTVTVTTNASGIARAFFVLPSASAGTICEIDATVGAGTGQTTIAFHETVGGSNYDVQSTASSISNLVGTFNTDGSEDLTWTNNTDDPVPIWKRNNAGDWVPFTTLPAGTTSYRMMNP